MSMFDDLDPMFEPSVTVALDNVAARVHTLRKRRRLTIAGSIGTIALVTALVTSAFTSGASGHPERVSISDNPTATTPDPKGRITTNNRIGNNGTRPTPTSVGVTSTSTPAPPRPTSVVPSPHVHSTSGPTGGGTSPAPVPTPPVPTPGPVTTTTVGQQTPARFRVVYVVSRLTLQSGTSTTVAYAIVNVGGTTGYLSIDPCNSAQELWPVPRGLWPAPISPRVSCAAAIERIPVAPGRSARFTHTLVAGRFSGTNVVPAYPGATLFAPPELPRPATTAAVRAGTLPVLITPPATAPFTADRPTQVTAGSGTEAQAPFSLTNHLPFPASFQFVGPRTRLRASATPSAGPCAGAPLPHHFTVFRCTFMVGAHVTLALELDLWATDNLLPPNPPGVLRLEPGDYTIPWNEIALQLVVVALDPP